MTVEKAVQTHLLPRFENALVHANEKHGQQRRKGTNVPYISHLLQVAGIVLEYGGDEDQAIGALLHDSVEDAQGEDGTTVADLYAEIERKFGARVCSIVRGCTDVPDDWKPGHKKPAWRERKEAYIQRVLLEPEDVRLVSAADKVANARSILQDQRRTGDAVFTRFNGGKAGTFWYYRALIEAYRQTGTNPWLVDELNRVIHQAELLAYPDERCP